MYTYVNTREVRFREKTNILVYGIKLPWDNGGTPFLGIYSFVMGASSADEEAGADTGISTVEVGSIDC